MGTVRLTPHPQAILENVIFVHQDDSNWPLAEGAVLKKKFDDIFAATKYTKALEAIRKIKTEQAQGIREKKLALETLRTHKDAAHKLRSDLAEAEAAHAVQHGRMQAAVEEEKEVEARLRGLRERAERHDALAAEVAVLVAKARSRRAEGRGDSGR